MYTHLMYTRLAIVCSSLLRFDVNPPSCRLDSYNPRTREWQRMPDPPIQGASLNAAVLAEKLYVIGGINVARTDTLVDVQVFDGQDWSIGPPLPSKSVCYNISAVSDADSILAICAPWSQTRTAFVLRDGVWRYYPCDAEPPSQESDWVPGPGGSLGDDLAAAYAERGCAVFPPGCTIAGHCL